MTIVLLLRHALYLFFSLVILYARIYTIAQKEKACGFAWKYIRDLLFLFSQENLLLPSYIRWNGYTLKSALDFQRHVPYISLRRDSRDTRERFLHSRVFVSKKKEKREKTWRKVVKRIRARTITEAESVDSYSALPLPLRSSRRHPRKVNASDLPSFCYDENTKRRRRKSHRHERISIIICVHDSFFFFFFFLFSSLAFSVRRSIYAQ